MKKIYNNLFDNYIVKKDKEKTIKNQLSNNSYNYKRNSKNITIGSSKTESSSAMNTLHKNKTLNRLKTNNNNIDYSEYFKINNHKCEQKIKKYDINDLNLYENKIIQNNNVKRFNNINYIYNNKEIITNHDFKNHYKDENFYNNLNGYYLSKNIISNIIYNQDNKNDIKEIYNKTGVMIDNDINNNMNKMEKERELLNLKKYLNTLKSQNKRIQIELEKMQDNKINKNIKIFGDIRNIFIKYENKIKNDNSQININDLFNFYKFKFGESSSFKEKIRFLRNIYKNEKLKNSLIEKIKKLILENILNKKKQNNLNNINTDNILEWINSLIEENNAIKKINEKIQINIDNINKEKNKYNFYYNNWINLLGVKNEKELKNKIKDLIIDQNYNDIEEIKLYNILMNKKA